MADQRKHESEDLRDFDTGDPDETLLGDPGDDPLDRGAAAPDRWSAGTRYALAGEEDSESLDELLAEEEPDEAADDSGDAEDENAPEADVSRYERDYEPDPRAGRLVSPDEDADAPDTLIDFEDEEVARDAGIAGGAASAEEAAVHVVDDEE